MGKFRFSFICLVGVVGVVAVSCGGGDSPKTPSPGTVCLVNSECNNPLSCSFGRCHSACTETRDCPTGLRCVVFDKDQGINICQLPDDENTCKYNTDCKSPLVCARDLKCRAQCRSDRDCTKNQKCLSPDNVCADPDEIDPGTMALKNSIDGSVPPPPPDAGGGGSDGGAGKDAPAGSDGPGGGGSDGGATPDAPMSSTDGRMVPDVDVTVEMVVATPASAPQGGSTVITVTGPNLADPGDFALGDLRASLQPGATANMFKLNVTVPHGVTLGPKTLTFTTAGGRGRKENVFTVTAITAGPMGNDMTGNGSADTPFRTFKRALQVATANDTVRLLDGEYRVADGETWMVPIPDKVNVEGQSAAGAKLIGPGETGGSVSVDGLTFAGDATVKNLSVAAFQYNIHVNKANANIALENIKSTGARYYGIYVNYQAMGAKVTLTGMDNDLSKNQSTAIYLYAPMVTFTASGDGPLGALASGAGMVIGGAKTTVSVTGFTFLQNMNRNAVQATVETTLHFEKTTFQDNIYVYNAMSTLELVDSTITLTGPNPGNAIDFGGTKLLLRGTTISGGQYGVHQSAGTSEATVRGSTIKGYTYYGYYIQAGKLDLGTLTDAGNNVFMGPDTGAYGLYDGRQSAVNSISSSNTTFNGFRPPAAKVTATAGAVNEAGKYYIQTIGNAIEFFEL
jgi:hypothetical protein